METCENIFMNWKKYIFLHIMEGMLERDDFLTMREFEVAINLVQKKNIINIYYTCKHIYPNIK